MTQIVNILSGTWSDSLDETNDCERVDQDMKVIFLEVPSVPVPGVIFPGAGV
jgi:hypothetical protein